MPGALWLVAEMVRAVLAVAERARTGLGGVGSQRDGWLRKREAYPGTGCVKHCQSVAADLALRACLVRGHQAGRKQQGSTRLLLPSWAPARRHWETEKHFGLDSECEEGLLHGGEGNIPPCHYLRHCTFPVVSHRQYQGLFPTLQDPCPGWQWWHSMAQELQIWLN